MAGAPKGNHNAAKGKAWTDELRKALAMYENKEAGIKRGQALRKVAERVVELAMIGNKDAWQEIGNRLDGKPHQSMEISGNLNHTAEALSDDELADIAAAGRSGVAEKAKGKAKSTQLH